MSNMDVFVKLLRMGFTRRIMLLGTKFLSLLNKHIPKSDNLVLFYESIRRFPQDNSEAMCYWLAENNRNSYYNIVYCVEELPNELAKRGVSRCSPAKAALIYLRAGHVFYSFGGLRIKPSPSQIVINLWHGSPLKALGKMTSDRQYAKEDLCDFTYVSTASPLFVKVMAESFGVSEGSIASHFVV